MNADPTWGYPPYQLACNYELWGQPDLAMAMFLKAIELGFDDFPMAYTDDELGHIRQQPDFINHLVAIRERYLASSASMVGQPIAVPASGEPPEGGWPIMLLLHGYGDTNESYLDHAQQWSEHGFVAVAVPGSVPRRADSYQWSMESTEPTHQDLTAILDAPILDGLINREQVFLLGFSQGALHALLLTAERPDVYAGVVALSPGGGTLAERMINPQLSQSRAARCLFIHGQQERHAPIAARWALVARSTGWKFETLTHPGGHHFPENWDSLVPDIAHFLTQADDSQ
jgi:predicted esterase